ncbi:unnamed protein product [Blepharisma stoltei]|uniref:Ion transport domain-containing protein n=1 Tax=Blepharisma stoltei TaxID=1481888 RepID=A0AAU9IRD2_9CILI|nr:unnamed protein product [Blepharisma stoltei]
MKTNFQSEEYFPRISISSQSPGGYQNQYKAAMSRLYYSPACKFFYFIMIILSATCVIWTLFNFGMYPIEGWFIALEIILIASISLELFFRAFMQGFWIFLKDYENAIDIFVAVVSIIGIVVGFKLNDKLADMEEYLSMFILLLRTSTNYMRLAIFVKNMRSTTISEISLTHITTERSQEKIEMNKPVAKYIVNRGRKNSKEFLDRKENPENCYDQSSISFA